MERIVVGTDGSGRSGAVVSQAVELARATGARLHLVTAYTPTSHLSDASAAMGVAAPAFSDVEVERSAAADLGATAERLRRAGIDVETHVCASGAADALCQVARTVDADLIVVGNKRMRGKGRILGSVASKVAHHAPGSIMIVDTGG